jgi:hypothetical protein
MWHEAAHAIFATLLIAVATFGIGTLILPHFSDSLTLATRYVCSWIAGFGLLGVLLFLIGQWRFTRITIGAALAIGVALALAHLYRASKSVNSVFIQTGKGFWIPASIIFAVLIITAIAGLAEPVGDWGVDNVAYHLIGSKVWLRDSVVRPIPDNFPASMPSDSEIMYATTAAFGGDRAPGFLPVFNTSLFLLIVGLLAIRCGANVSGAFWAAALVVAMPAVYEGSHSGFIDVIYASFVLAGIRVGLDARNTKDFALLGLFGGLAMAAKYPGLVIFPAILICSAWPRATSTGRHYKAAFGSACVACLVACVVASPFYLRNWIMLGSPIYAPPPFAARFMHVKYLSESALRGIYGFSIRRGVGHGRNLVESFLLPFNLTYHTADFHGAGGIGLAPLALGPLGVIAGWRDTFSRRMAVLACLLAFLWFLTDQESRYLIDVYAITAVFAVVGWRYAVTLSGRTAKALCAIIVAFSVAYGLFMIVEARSSEMHSVFSRSFAEERRHADIPFIDSFDFVNHDPSVTKLMILDPYVLGYYSDKDYVKPFGQWGEQTLPNVTTAADALSELAQLHISHILDVTSPDSGFRVPPNYPGLTLVFSESDERIYRYNGGH